MRAYRTALERSVVMALFTFGMFISGAAATESDATILSIFERNELTGEWWGARSAIESCGINLDVSLTQFYQGVAAGGNQQAGEYGGKIDAYLTFDSNKASWWSGFNLAVHSETRYGTDVNDIDGLFSFGNFNLAFPKSKIIGTG